MDYVLIKSLYLAHPNMLKINKYLATKTVEVLRDTFQKQ